MATLREWLDPWEDQYGTITRVLVPKYRRWSAFDGTWDQAKLDGVADVSFDPAQFDDYPPIEAWTENGVYQLMNPDNV